MCLSIRCILDQEENLLLTHELLLYLTFSKKMRGDKVFGNPPFSSISRVPCVGNSSYSVMLIAVNLNKCYGHGLKMCISFGNNLKIFW